MRVNAGRLVPVAAKPIGDEADGVVVQHFVLAEGGHAVVALAVKAGVGGIGNEIDEPIARSVAGEIGRGGIFVGLMELMTLSAAHDFAGDERFAFDDKGSVALIEVDL